MSQERGQTLLLVLPGAAGRKPVLQRLQSFAKICVLVPSTDLQRSGWARDVVGDDCWIQVDGATSMFDAALAAVKSWLAQGDSYRVDGVVTYDEFGIELCAFIGGSLGLPCTPVGHIRKLRNKSQFREHCTAAGIPAVRHTILRTEADVDAVLAPGSSWRFPAVLKPVKGAGSWHVCKIESANELRETFAQLSAGMLAGSFPKDIQEAAFTLEEYFEGCEVDVDGWVRDGKVEFCMVNDNRPAMEPYFIELGGFYPSQLPSDAIAALEQLTHQVVAAFPGLHTCFHFEAKINPSTLAVMPIEFNARVGGAECPASVEAVTGYYLPEVAARLALGHVVEPAPKRHNVVASTNLHIFEKGILAECSDAAVDSEATKLVTSVFLGKVGSPHVPNNGSMSCLGWMASGGQTAEEAEENLQKAISQARFAVSPEKAYRPEGCECENPMCTHCGHGGA